METVFIVHSPKSVRRYLSQEYRGFFSVPVEVQPVSCEWNPGGKESMVYAYSPLQGATYPLGLVNKSTGRFVVTGDCRIASKYDLTKKQLESARRIPAPVA